MRTHMWVRTGIGWQNPCIILRNAPHPLTLMSNLCKSSCVMRGRNPVWMWVLVFYEIYFYAV